MPFNLTGSPVPISNLTWQTDTDWNKGTLGSDVEVSGAGSEAVIRPNAEFIPGTDIYLVWHLNELSGTTVADSSQYNRSGTLITPEGYNPAQWVTGQLNNAISNPGEYESQCYIDGGNIAGFEWNTPFSIECWMNRAPYDISIAGNYSAEDGKGWFLGVQEGFFRFSLSGGGENFIQVYSATQFPAEFWQHVVVTYDGSGLASGISFYINGILDTTSVYYDGLAEVSIVPATNNLSVGALLGAGWGFIGQIDEFNLYTKVLSQSDVDFRYNTGTGTETFLELDDVFKTSAHYETSIYDSGLPNQLWELVYVIADSIPVGTTITAKVRTSNTAGTMGNYGDPLVSGTEINLSGQYIQFSVDFTGTTTERAALDYLSVFFRPIATKVSP